MVDQIYYKIQYPLKKSIDMMKVIDKKNINEIAENLTEYDKEKIEAFISHWSENGKKELQDLVNNLRQSK
ncbi:hypothetical protein [Halanaerobium hydrogeniformans]|uniref:Uncharacterized protein n=1 Tax=Halanaerobium hydrogeniformans TaxID=656519 RepID=E4RIK9_HALHG|nr:hypothetical protein [Halanaerobium hydrogeniformans]ADQ15079.1 hypothetical protein Halsa_1656 [Halanaerobium hydrogeniformans]